MIYPQVENIAFCCANCGVPVIQNSREHDESVCSPDGEDWYCVNCHECVEPIQDQDETIFEVVLGMFENIQEQYSQDNRPHFRSILFRTNFIPFSTILLNVRKKSWKKVKLAAYGRITTRGHVPIKQKTNKNAVMEWRFIWYRPVLITQSVCKLLLDCTEEQGLHPDEKTDRCVCCGIS